MAVLLTFAMIFVIIVALLLPVFGHMIGLYLSSTFGFSETFLALWSASRWIISGLILFTVLRGCITLLLIKAADSKCCKRSGFCYGRVDSGIDAVCVLRKSFQ